MDVSTPTSPPDVVVRFVRTVARRPHVVAVEADDGVLTYEALDRLAGRLAQRLRALLPAGSETPRVGVSLPRGATELVALLAVLEAGAAYVPLDPSYPIERLRLVLEDATPDVLIVHPASPLAQLAAVRHVVWLDGLGALEAAPPAPAPAPTPAVVPRPEAIAYVMFTSGSTGRPKGVEITRGALASFLHAMAHAPGLAQHDRLLAVSTTAFDIAGLDLFLPLWVGATVIIADRETVRDPGRLRQRLERGDVTLMQATPAKWRLLLEAGWRGGGRPLRMLCGGEALLPALADRLLATGGELWNVYGPTEATVWCSLQRIEPGYDRITIGRPIAGMQMVVVDEGLVPVPPGIDGELVIGGVGLARGYCGRPDLTAERFVDHPGLGRIYRTGDRCRQLPDGRFEWLGRLDHQVKIAGVRVELGEIEARLEAVPGVSQAVVVAHPREGGEVSLCAYWVGTAEREALVAAARRFLPAPVVPSAWVRLPRLPLSPNGKVDRKQLPPPAADAGVDEPGKRPTCDAELRIATIFRDVLGLSQVPVDRDFFALGGTSVLAARVALRLREALGVEVPLRLLFEAPTVEQLAARIGHDVGGDAPIVVTLRPGPADRPALFGLVGVHLFQDLALALARERTVVGMHVPLRYVPGQQPPPGLPEIAARYAALVRRQQRQGPYHLVGLCFGGIVAYEVARQLEAAGERVATVTIVDAVLPGAVHVDAGGGLRSLVRAVARATRDPGALRRRFGPRRFEWRGERRSALGGATPVELAIDGPELEAEVQRFAATRTHIDARLLVVRATAAPWPSWQSVERDQGWRARAREVVVLDVPADHLGVLREPHVRALARVLDALQDEETPATMRGAAACGRPSSPCSET